MIPTGSAIPKLNWRGTVSTWVAEFRARRLMKLAERLNREADARERLAAEFREAKAICKMQARDCTRRAVAIAPWIVEAK